MSIDDVRTGHKTQWKLERPIYRYNIWAKKKKSIDTIGSTLQSKKNKKQVTSGDQRLSQTTPMYRATQILLRGRKALEDLDLIKVLQSEIKHELSSPLSQENRSGSLGDFVVDWDSSHSEDVVLRRKFESGEEVAVSALLHPNCSTDLLMKVFVKKPGLNSILQFDCGVSENGTNGSQFDIHNAYYLKSTTCPGPSAYRGPLFSDLDPRLQDALKEYLVAKGVSESFTNFILLRLQEKEQGQYVNWLQKIESLVAKDD